MLIAEFSKAAGLAVGTVRFYVRSGLLNRKTGALGGSRPYMVFSDQDLRRIAAIKAGQAMGMSLAEIKLLVDERRAGAGKAKMLQALVLHRQKLAQRKIELDALVRFVDAKIAWLRNGGTVPMPELQGEQRRQPHSGTSTK